MFEMFEMFSYHSYHSLGECLHKSKYSKLNPRKNPYFSKAEAEIVLIYIGRLVRNLLFDSYAGECGTCPLHAGISLDTGMTNQTTNLV